MPRAAAAARAGDGLEPAAAVPLVIDTDVGTDVDDALALAFAARHPDIELHAVTTVSGDTVGRAQIARKVLALAEAGEVEVAAGVPGTAPGATRSPWAGHEGDGLVDLADVATSPRDGVSVLAEAATTCELVTLGMQTNVAAALDRDPGLADRIARMTVMGGVFAPIVEGDQVLPPAIDHNLNCDPHAAVRALNSPIPKLFVPADVTVRAVLTHAHVDRLRRGDALCRALADTIDLHPELGKPGRDPLAEVRAATLHDPLAVACTVDRSYVTVEEKPVTVALHEGRVRTFVDPLEGGLAEVVTSVDGEAFVEHWLSVVLA